MSQIVQFRLPDGDYEQLAAFSAGIAPNKKAKEIVLDAIYGQDKGYESVLKVAVRTLSTLQRFAALKVTEDHGKEALEQLLADARNDEEKLLNLLGVTNG